MPDGLQPQCKNCNKNYRALKKDKIKAYFKDYYQKNREYLDKQNKVSLKKHYEKHLVICRNYRVSHRSQYTNYAANRRAKIKDQFLETIDRNVVLSNSNYHCGICSQLLIGEFHVDHIVPISKGGLHCYSNVQAAHPWCNLQKNNSYIK